MQVAEVAGKITAAAHKPMAELAAVATVQLFHLYPVAQEQQVPEAAVAAHLIMELQARRLTAAQVGLV
jgi:hypothetical protein